MPEPFDMPEDFPPDMPPSGPEMMDEFGAELDTTPHSMEAEQALLGALLYDNEIYHRVSSIVEAKHFYNPLHVNIFRAMASLIEHGKLADAIVLKNRFAKDDALNDIGGV